MPKRSRQRLSGKNVSRFCGAGQARQQNRGRNPQNYRHSFNLPEHPYPGRWPVILALWAFAVGVVLFWISFFGEGAVRPSDDPCYIAFERNFVAADLVTAAAGLICAEGLRLELSGSGIDAAIVCPRDFNTGFTSTRSAQACSGAWTTSAYGSAATSTHSASR